MHSSGLHQGQSVHSIKYCYDTVIDSYNNSITYYSIVSVANMESIEMLISSPFNGHRNTCIIIGIDSYLF